MEEDDPLASIASLLQDDPLADLLVGGGGEVIEEKEEKEEKEEIDDEEERKIEDVDDAYVKIPKFQTQKFLLNELDIHIAYMYKCSSSLCLSTHLLKHTLTSLQ